MGDQVADDHVEAGPHAPERPRGPRRSQDRRRRAQALGDVGGQSRPDGGDANPSCPHVLELRLLPIAHEQRDVVATGAELERGIDDEALGAADAEAGAEEGDAEAGRGRHGREESLLLSCFLIGIVDTDCTQVDCTEVGAQTVVMDHSCTVAVAVVSPAGTPRPDRESRQGSTVAGLP